MGEEEEEKSFYVCTLKDYGSDNNGGLESFNENNLSVYDRRHFVCVLSLLV